MLDGLKYKPFFKTSYSVGMHVHLEDDESIHFKALVLKNQKGKPLVLAEFDRFEDLLNAAAKYTSEYVYSLSITGKGILEKQTNYYENTDTINLSAILPGTSEKNFDYSMLPTINESELVVYLTRKETSENLLNRYTNSEFKISSLFIGYSALEALGIVLSTTNPVTLYLQNQQFEFSGARYIKKSVSTANPPTLELNGFNITAQNALAFATALQYFVQPLGGIVPTSEIVKVQQETETNSRFFKKILFVSVISFTLLFFVNFFLNYIGAQQRDQLNAQIQQNAMVFTRLQTLQKEVKEKEEFLKSNGLLADSRLSFYSDRIAQTVPDGFRLTQLTVNPLQKSQAGKEDIKFRNNYIKVLGECGNTEKLAQWIDVLKQFNWSKKVLLESFVQEKDSRTGSFSISIEIK